MAAPSHPLTQVRQIGALFLFSFGIFYLEFVIYLKIGAW